MYKKYPQGGHYAAVFLIAGNTSIKFEISQSYFLHLLNFEQVIPT